MDNHKDDKIASAKPGNTSVDISASTLGTLHLMHRHDGSAMGGQTLYGPYFIRDTTNGNTYKIISKGGVLTLVQV